MAGYWLSSFVAILMTERKPRSIKVRKKIRLKSSYFFLQRLANIGLIILRKDTIRIKNGFFERREKKAIVFVAQLTHKGVLFSLFDCLQPLFESSPPTLSQSFEPFG